MIPSRRPAGGGGFLAFLAFLIYAAWLGVLAWAIITLVIHFTEG